MKRYLQILGIFTIALMFTAITVEAKGKKYGLFVGINAYPKAIGALAGCENDAQEMQKVLAARYGFVKTDTTVLLSAKATRQAIIEEIKRYSGKVGAGDVFVFHYSGHGSLFPDSESEELDETEEIFFEDSDTGEIIYPKDKYDATLVPVDAMDSTSGKPWGNQILDDELYGLFSEFTKKGAQVVFISDSCFSGGISRAQAQKVQKRFVPALRIFGAKSWDDLKLKKPATQRNVTDRPMNSLYIVLTAANANETALDGAPKALQMGLFTENLVGELKKTKSNKLTYSVLMNNVSKSVSALAKTKFQHDQNPQLEKRFGKVDTVIFSAPK